MKRALFLAVVLAVSSVGQAAEVADLGRIEFTNSGSAVAQAPFVRGMLLLHSFEYEDAREEFQAAQEADPEFALAYWGEAMTHNHPLWRRQNRDAALEVLRRYAPTAAERTAKAPTEREAGYLAALDVLFGYGEKLPRDIAYSRAMGKLAQRHPDDLEAASFYALSILGTAQGERDFRIYMQAAAVVEEVFDRNPRHPGAIHYLIHSYDDPVHAPLGLRAARIYAEIAPAASHAQHMISHIFVALGDWDEVVSANVKSFAVSEERSRRKGLPIYKRNHHALHWLQYAHLQQGRFSEARKEMEIIESDARAGGVRGSRAYFAIMRAAYAVHTAEGWPAREDIALEDTGVSTIVSDMFATGWMAWRTGDREALSSTIELMEESIKSKRAAKEDEDVSQGDSPASFAAAEVMTQELRALLLKARGKSAQTVELLEAATIVEDGMPLAFGPPEIVKSSHELLGEVLLDLDRPAEAMNQFEIALELMPRRTMSLLGLARAAAGAGDDKRSREAYAELRTILHDADPDLPALAEVRNRLAAATATRGD